MAHCRCTAAINFALDAGVDAILHCHFNDSDGEYRFDQPTADRLAASENLVEPDVAPRPGLPARIGDDAKGTGSDRGRTGKARPVGPDRGRHYGAVWPSYRSRSEAGGRLRLRLGPLSLRRLSRRAAGDGRRRAIAHGSNSGRVAGTPQPRCGFWARPAPSKPAKPPISC